MTLKNHAIRAVRSIPLKKIYSEVIEDTDRLASTTGWLIPSANGVLYRSGELDIMPSVSSSYVAEMPEDGSFFVLSYVEYKSN